MSGIVGSRLNIRGSGLVGGLGTDGQVLTSAGAGQEIVFESVSSAAITAINNATANELVTVGSTTTELDAESGLTYTDGALVIGGTTPSLTIGDAGAEDTKIVFDGNAQDFHIGLDDTADDLVIGLGSALGTTPAIEIDENLKVNISVTTASTSASTGSLTTGGGAGIGADLYVGDDTYLITDSAVLGFGADKDTLLTHTDGTGLTLNSTNKLTFGDAATYVNQSSDGVMTIAGEATIDLTASTAVLVSNDLKLDSDSSVIGFGADNDTTLTHTDGTGLTLNSTNKICFNDASQFIQGSSNAILALGATDEIDLTATAVDLNGTLDVSGNSQFSGTITVGVDDTGKDVKLFGASAGAYMEWDESADELRIMGASADATTSTGKLLLATSLTDINANDVIGKIDFQAPHEAGGTDAITVAASIRAVAQGTFSASVNATDLIFYTGHSEAAAEKFRFTSQNEIGVAGANYGTDGQVLTSGGAGAAVAWEDAGGASTLAAMTDVSMDITDFTDGILIQPNSDGSAPTTGTLNAATGNIGIGKDVFKAATTVDRNVAIGYECADGLASGDKNIYIGYQAGRTTGLTSANHNVFMGSNTGAALTSGENNIAIGNQAGEAITTASQNIFMGYQAGEAHTTGASNSYYGYRAGWKSTTEIQNVFIGAFAGKGEISGAQFNTLVGYGCGAAGPTSGDYNVGLGNEVFNTLSTGSRNTGLGYGALNAITSGDSNVGIGDGALDKCDTEDENIAIGKNACGTASAGLDGSQRNICLGSSSFQGLTTGQYNIGIGYSTATTNTTGDDNIAIGYSAGDTGDTGDDNIAIGAYSDSSAADSANSIAIGQTVLAASNDFSFGKSGNVVTNDFDADANWSRSSDERIKRNVNDDTLGLDFINDLRTVTYQWKPSNEVPKELTSEYNEENQKNLDAVMHGFIAQEVKASMDKVGNTTFAGWKIDETDGVTQRTSREMFVMPLIKAVQELSAQVTTLQDEIKTLKGD